MTQSKTRTFQLTVILVALLLCLTGAFAASAGERALSNDDSQALKEISTLLTSFDTAMGFNPGGTTPSTSLGVKQLDLTECELGDLMCEGDCFYILVNCGYGGGFGGICMEMFNACVQNCQDNSLCNL